MKYVGFSPLETIRSATKTGAKIMDCQDQFGTLEAGKLADIVVVDGDSWPTSRSWKTVGD